MDIEVIDGQLYWLKPHGDEKWTVGEAMVWSADYDDPDINFYIPGCDWGRPMNEFEIGPRLKRHHG